MAYDLCIRDEVTGKSLPLVHYNDAGEKDYVYQEILDQIKTIGAHGMQSKMYFCNAAVHGISFPQLTSVGIYGLSGAFGYCTGLTSISLPQLTSVDSYGLSYAFQGCTGLTSMEFPQLKSVGGHGLVQAFTGCTGLTSISFPQLESVDDGGFSSAFSGCTGLTGSVSFPKLTSVGGTTGFQNAFLNCTQITELHFRRDAQAVIQALGTYDTKFGATNATIYFDL